jgi:hypothetical protein
MDATITNLGTSSPEDDVFISGPRISLAAGASMVWPNLTAADLDSAAQLKGLVAAGKVSVSIALTSADATVPLMGSFSPSKLQRYTFAQLPSGSDAVDGQVAFCTNGRKVGEGAAAGTGVPVYRDGGSWRVYATDAAVAV